MNCIGLYGDREALERCEQYWMFKIEYGDLKALERCEQYWMFEIVGSSLINVLYVQ